MTNRKLGYIVKDQEPILMGDADTIQQACQRMWERRAGSVLVLDGDGQLAGIFTGRDAVRSIAQGKNAAKTKLADSMTMNPVTISAGCTAIDALRMMSDGGFRHLPVVENDGIWGVVSRGDFTGTELDRLDEEEHLWECIR